MGRWIEIEALDHDGRFAAWEARPGSQPAWWPRCRPAPPRGAPATTPAAPAAATDTG